MARAEVWIVGDWQHEHFAAPIEWLRHRADCHFFANVSAALSAADANQRPRDPAALLLVQSRPGQISNRDVERLHSAAPLARLVGLIGPWCEGEGRSGRPWPGVIRISWRHWRWRLSRELWLGAPDQVPGLRLPRVATDSDRLLHSIAHAAMSGRFTGYAELLTASPKIFESWQCMLRLLGVDCCCPTLHHHPIRPCDFQIIDGWENSPPASPSADSPCRVLLLHFPRPDDVDRAASSGITAILAQPLLLADLTTVLGGFALRVPGAAHQPAA